MNVRRPIENKTIIYISLKGLFDDLSVLNLYPSRTAHTLDLVHNTIPAKMEAFLMAALPSFRVENEKSHILSAVVVI
ncbi:hypothetical protein GDO81_010294 [Engystomops pustulosus]|uniref:Uncharacterized protein n=1 Tax=Engystomops pustulosus TaxID=76066 RepID=A0AAV7BYJ5_ENGPU|nr:hypothetical protein GDO81_010294 [Engystomops pustulosus]